MGQSIRQRRQRQERDTEPKGQALPREKIKGMTEKEGVEEEVVSSIEAKRSRRQGASKERKPRIQQS